MALGGGSDLLLTWSHNHWIKKVPTQIHRSKRNVEHHVGDTIRLGHVLAQDVDNSTGVSHVRRHQMTAAGSIKKANGSIKGPLQLKKILHDIQEINLVTV